MRLATLPWAVERRHLWPRSFRAGVRTVMLVASRLYKSETRLGLPDDAWLEVLSYCGREWFPRLGHGVKAPGRRRDVWKIQCEWCGRAAWTKSGLKQCSKCKQVRYCDEACQHCAWETHKAWCKAHRRR